MQIEFCPNICHGETGRVALRPSCGFVAHGGEKVDPRAKRASDWWLQKSEFVSPRMAKLIGGRAGLRVCSDACASDGSLAAAARFEKHFAVSLTREANPTPSRDQRDLRGRRVAHGRGLGRFMLSLGRRKNHYVFRQLGCSWFCTRSLIEGATCLSFY